LPDEIIFEIFSLLDGISLITAFHRLLYLIYDDYIKLNDYRLYKMLKTVSYYFSMKIIDMIKSIVLRVEQRTNLPYLSANQLDSRQTFLSIYPKEDLIDSIITRIQNPVIKDPAAERKADRIGSNILFNLSVFNEYPELYKNYYKNHEKISIESNINKIYYLSLYEIYRVVKFNNYMSFTTNYISHRNEDTITLIKSLIV